MNSNLLRILFYIVTLFFLSSCATYVSKSGPDTARLKVIINNGAGCLSCFARISESNTCNPDPSVLIDKKDWVGIYINPGKRIWIEEGYEGGWQVITSCRIITSFVPDPRVTYAAEYNVVGGGCNMTVYKIAEDGKKIPEPSAKQEDSKGMCWF